MQQQHGNKRIKKEKQQQVSPIRKQMDFKKNAQQQPARDPKTQ